MPLETNHPSVVSKFHSMHWLKTASKSEGASNMESKLIDATELKATLKSIPKKEEMNEDYFPGTSKSKKSRNKKSHDKKKVDNKMNKENLDCKGSETQVKEDTVETKAEEKAVVPSAWGSNTSAAQTLFPNVQSTQIPNATEEEVLNKVIVESVCSAQKEDLERKEVQKNSNSKEALQKNDSDEDDWGKIKPNLPDPSLLNESIKNDSNNNEGKDLNYVDKFGRVDGKTEKHLFMGKGGRRKEQEFLKSHNDFKAPVQQQQVLENIKTQKPENQSTSSASVIKSNDPKTSKIQQNHATPTSNSTQNEKFQQNVSKKDYNANTNKAQDDYQKQQHHFNNNQNKSSHYNVANGKDFQKVNKDKRDFHQQQPNRLNNANFNNDYHNQRNNRKEFQGQQSYQQGRKQDWQQTNTQSNRNQDHNSSTMKRHQYSNRNYENNSRNQGGYYNKNIEHQNSRNSYQGGYYSNYRHQDYRSHPPQNYNNKHSQGNYYNKPHDQHQQNKHQQQVEPSIKVQEQKKVEVPEAQISLSNSEENWDESKKSDKSSTSAKSQAQNDQEIKDINNDTTFYNKEELPKQNSPPQQPLPIMKADTQSKQLDEITQKPVSSDSVPKKLDSSENSLCNNQTNLHHSTPNTTTTPEPLKELENEFNQRLNINNADQNLNSNLDTAYVTNQNGIANCATVLPFQQQQSNEMYSPISNSLNTLPPAPSQQLPAMTTYVNTNLCGNIEIGPSYTHATIPCTSFNLYNQNASYSSSVPYDYACYQNPTAINNGPYAANVTLTHHMMQNGQSYSVGMIPVMPIQSIDMNDPQYHTGDIASTQELTRLHNTVKSLYTQLASAQANLLAAQVKFFHQSQTRGSSQQPMARNDVNSYVQNPMPLQSIPSNGNSQGLQSQSLGHCDYNSPLNYATPPGFQGTLQPPSNTQKLANSNFDLPKTYNPHVPSDTEDTKYYQSSSSSRSNTDSHSNSSSTKYQQQSKDNQHSYLNYHPSGVNNRSFYPANNTNINRAPKSSSHYNDQNGTGGGGYSSGRRY